MPALPADSRGFTLWEALIVVLIVTISAATAAPHLRQWQVRMQEQAEARAVLAAFQQARSNAVRHNRNVLLEFTEATAHEPGGFRVITENAAGDLTELRSFQAFSALRLERASFSLGTAVGGFDHRGLPSNGAGSLDLRGTRGNTRYLLTQTLYGGVRLTP